MNSEILCRRRLDDSPVLVAWNQHSSVSGNFETACGPITIKHGLLKGGKSEGVEVVLVDTGAVRVLLLPSRGMGIWKMWAGHVEIGWASPVDGPVHPSYVPVMDPDGLGWLEGFDELVVRCGLESNGAPEKHENGTLRYPLHGRIANLPARDLRVEVNQETGYVELIGDVVESKLFFKRLRLTSRAGFFANSSTVHIIDEVTNERTVPASMQLLYHINVGVPILANGSTLDIAFDEIAPKDALSASEIQAWNQMGTPQSGYGERVYFVVPKADDANWACAMLSNVDSGIGLGVQFDTRTLPYFIAWKNTAANEDGYVLGLEPSTNFPNHRSFEESQGRVVSLAAGETKVFRITLHPLTAHDDVDALRRSIQKQSKDSDQIVRDAPKHDWTAGL